MKILLLTDVPPCRHFTVGQVLEQLCRFLPRGSIACFAMIDRHLDARLSRDLDWIPIAYTRKRNESAFRRFPGRLSLPAAWLVEKMYRCFVTPRLSRQALEFGRAQKVDLVWAVLHGQTITQIASGLAHALRVPLITQVGDPLNWWLLAHQIDRFNRRSALADFDRALQASCTCIAASSAMAKAYELRHGTRSVPVMTGLPEEWAKCPDLHKFPRDEIDIGMAGQFYAGVEWYHLVRALDMSGWQVRGKAVRLTVLGAIPPPGPRPFNRVRYLGWHDQPDAIEVLSRLDLLYCPYPFGQEIDEALRLSFSSKIPLYLAAGRPIVYHGPRHSAPAEYLRDWNAGLMVDALNSTAVYNALCRLVDNPRLYAILGANAQRAFQCDFTLDQMKLSFEQALGISLDQLSSSTAKTAEPHYFPDVSEAPIIRTMVSVVHAGGRMLAHIAESRRTVPRAAAALRRGLRVIAKSVLARAADPLLQAWIARMLRQRDAALISAALDSHTVFVHLSSVSGALLSHPEHSDMGLRQEAVQELSLVDNAIFPGHSNQINGRPHSQALLKLTMADLERLVTEIKSLESRLEHLHMTGGTILDEAAGSQSHGPADDLSSGQA